MRGLVLLAAATVLSAAEPYRDTVVPFLRARYAGCHCGASPAGGLAIDALVRLPESQALRERLRWERMASRMLSGEIPPKGAARPPADQVKAVAAWIEQRYA